MKTKEEIRIEFYGEHDARAYDYDELYIMELYAKEYHEQQVNLLNEPAVSKSEDIEREALLLAYAKWRDEIVVHRRLKPEELVKVFLSKQ